MPKLLHYANVLENHFHDMMDFEFTVENGEFYIDSARVAKRSNLAHLRIIMELFCKEVISVEELILKLSGTQWDNLLDEKIIINTNEIETLLKGMPASKGIAVANVCFSIEAANKLIDNKQPFILYLPEIGPDSDRESVFSSYCKGVIAQRGGMTSHAAVICQIKGIPCVSGVGENDIKQLMLNVDNGIITIDGNKGVVYKGAAKIERVYPTLNEIKYLKKLLGIIIKNNIVSSETGILVWRLWNVFILMKHYTHYLQIDNTKVVIQKDTYQYKSFSQPSIEELRSITENLVYCNYANIFIEDFLNFIILQISENAPIGCHHLFMRPLIDPIKTIQVRNEKNASPKFESFTQLTGVEFFNINRYVDFLPDIYSFKVYFLTEYCYDKDVYGDIITSLENPSERIWIPINYLDYTNPNGEGMVINNYNAKGILFYVNDVVINENDLGFFYHLLRKRKYYWTWYDDNNTSKNEIKDYLSAFPFQRGKNIKLYNLCQELHLVNGESLTKIGKSLIGRDNMENNRDIDYILDEVVRRGCDTRSNESNDYYHLLQIKDFKDLVALELYEYYFWDDRHEFDLQLLKSIIDNVCRYFSDPSTIQQVENGILQALPTALIVFMLERISSKLQLLTNKKRTTTDSENNSWIRIEENIKKIDKEFLNHDYIKSEDIETIFKVPREEIQPLLKLYGCKCFINKKHCIWIKLGTSETRVREILMHNKFYK